MEDVRCACPSPEEVRSTMPREEEIAALAEFFRLIGSDTRLKILLALDQCELCAGALSDAVGMAPSAVSNQLKALRQARLVTVRREGKQLFYRLSDCHPRGIIHQAMHHLSEEKNELF